MLVITDADVGHVDREPRFDADPGGDSEPSASTSWEEPAESVVEVVGWQERVDPLANTLLVFGTAANRGPSVATATRLEVRLLDGSGDLLQRRRATLAPAVLAPGAVAEFSATFPGSPGFESIEFEIESRGFRLRPAPESESVPDQ